MPGWDRSRAGDAGGLSGRAPGCDTSPLVFALSRGSLRMIRSSLVLAMAVVSTLAVAAPPAAAVLFAAPTAGRGGVLLGCGGGDQLRPTGFSSRAFYFQNLGAPSGVGPPLTK